MTREERIKKLQCLITCMKCEVSGKYCDNNCPTQYDAGNMGEIIENLEEIAKALEQEPKWIPVSERLPNDEDYVLVYYENGHIRTAYYYIDTNIYPSEFEDCCDTGWYNYDEDFMYEQDVVAWMPLPEPYKAESEETK